MTEPRKQIGGTHYNSKNIMPFDVIDQIGPEAWVFYWGNALKYLMRFKDKNGKEDLEKALHYIELLMGSLYGGKDD